MHFYQVHVYSFLFSHRLVPQLSCFYFSYLYIPSIMPTRGSHICPLGSRPGRQIKGLNPPPRFWGPGPRTEDFKFDPGPFPRGWLGVGSPDLGPGLLWNPLPWWPVITGALSVESTLDIQFWIVECSTLCWRVLGLNTFNFDSWMLNWMVKTFNFDSWMLSWMVRYSTLVQVLIVEC